MSPPPPPSGRAWLVVALLWIVGLLNYLDRVMISSMHGSIKEAIPMDEKQFGLLATVFLVTYGALSPLGGWVADRFGRSRVVIGSVAVWSLVTLLTAFVKTYPQLLATRALMGISEACYIPAALALIADYHRHGTRSFATGLHMSGVYTGAALGGAGGWIAQHYGWSVGFAVFGGFGVAYAVFLLFILRDGPREDRPADRPLERGDSIGVALLALGKKGPFWLLVAYWGLLGMAGWAVIHWLPTYIKEHFHVDQGVAGFTATFYSHLAAFIGVLVGGFVADRWRRRTPRARIYVPVIALTIAAPILFLASGTVLLWVMIVGLLFYGFSRGCTDANMMPILCEVADPKHRATGYGVLNLFSCVVGGITTYAGGALKDAHVDLGRVFQTAAGCLAVCAVLLIFVRPKVVAPVEATVAPGPGE